MLTLEERLNPENTLQEIYDHYKLGNYKTESTEHVLLVDSEDLGKNVVCLFSTFEMGTKFRAIIDYDPDYKTSLIRIYSDHIQ